MNDSTKLSKIAITEDSDQAITQLLNLVNKNFDAGRITKTELSSWILKKASENPTQDFIKEVQDAHFNQLSYLEALIKNLKNSERTSLNEEEVKKLIKSQRKNPDKKQSITIKSGSN